VVERVCVVFIIVVGPQVEVCTDLHPIGEQFDDVSAKKRVSDLFESFRLELRPEVVEYRICRW